MYRDDGLSEGDMQALLRAFPNQTLGAPGGGAGVPGAARQQRQSGHAPAPSALLHLLPH